MKKHFYAQRWLAFGYLIFCGALFCISACDDGLSKAIDKLFVKIPPNQDKTPPIITWEILDLNDPGAVKKTYTDKVNDISLKVGSYYGINVYCTDDDGGVKILTLDDAIYSECTYEDGTVSINPAAKTTDIQDFSFLTDLVFKTLSFSKKVNFDHYGCGRRDLAPGTLGATTETFKAVGENYRGGKAESEFRFNIIR